MFLIKKSPFSGGRDKLGEFLNTRGLTNYGVEIGTHRGEFAEVLLNDWTGKLTCIDPWDHLPEYAYQEQFLDSSDGNREADYICARDRLARFEDRANLLKMTSEQASTMYNSDAFDFVYVDGNHATPHVLHDLELWWPKLGPGGIIAGHDIIMPGWSRGDLWEHDVQNAVFQFASSRQLIVWLIPENEDNHRPWSYYMEKPL